MGEKGRYEGQNRWYRLVGDVKLPEVIEQGVSDLKIQVQFSTDGGRIFELDLVANWIFVYPRCCQINGETEMEGRKYRFELICREEVATNNGIKLKPL